MIRSYLHPTATDGDARYGQLSVLLLTYITTQADHRLCAVEPWVKQHHRTLEMATGWKIGVKDATDDRLANLLSVLGSSQHQAIQSIETCLGQYRQMLATVDPLGMPLQGCHSSWQWHG